MMKIAKSLAMIAFVAAIGVYATSSFFSDTETSTNNTFTAGTIDISVDEENPWVNSWTNYLDKPCQVSYMTFVIENIGENPANIWKRLTNVINGPGENDTYKCTVDMNTVPVSSEPECEEGTDNYTHPYVERDTLSAFMIYDMAICKIPAGVAEDGYCPFVTGDDDYPEANKKPDLEDASDRWTILVDEDNQIRVDNVVDTWIKLNSELQPDEKLVVSQSYHLMAWDDSGEVMITNWAQGDTMKFDVELEARQLTAPAPGVSEDGTATINIVEKDTTVDDWTIIENGAGGTLTYGVKGEEFVYDLNLAGLKESTNYCLIYYADPYPGNGPSHTSGALIQSYSLGIGITTIDDMNRSVELNTDLPDADDLNSATGAKLWLVLCGDYSTNVAGDQGELTTWTNFSEYLYDDGLVNYDDISI